MNKLIKKVAAIRKRIKGFRLAAIAKKEIRNNPEIDPEAKKLIEDLSRLTDKTTDEIREFVKRNTKNKKDGKEN